MLYLHTTDKKIQETIKKHFKLSKVITYPGELFQEDAVKFLYTNSDFYQLAVKLTRMLLGISIQKNDFIVSIESTSENHTANSAIINKISQPDKIDCYPDILIKHSFLEMALKEETAYHFYRITSEFFSCEKIIILRVSEADLKKAIDFLESLILENENSSLKELFIELCSRYKFSYAQKKVISKLLHYQQLKKTNIEELLAKFYQETNEENSYEKLKTMLSL
ncbi:MAG: hypothetical protein FWE36_01735 [Erysipelotrichales bacterium]|nr:hypothetical protein [Erysipelotrichales bacterium]